MRTYLLFSTASFRLAPAISLRTPRSRSGGGIKPASYVVCAGRTDAKLPSSFKSAAVAASSRSLGGLPLLQMAAAAVAVATAAVCWSGRSWRRRPRCRFRGGEAAAVGCCGGGGDGGCGGGFPAGDGERPRSSGATRRRGPWRRRRRQREAEWPACKEG